MYVWMYVCVRVGMYVCIYVWECVCVNAFHHQQLVKEELSRAFDLLFPKEFNLIISLFGALAL